MEEKLKHFHEASINSAHEKSRKAIEDYNDVLERKYTEHVTEMQKRAEIDFKNETDVIIRDRNEKYSNSQGYIKKELNKKSQELTDRIFEELLLLIEKYKETDEYKKLLLRQIGRVRDYAKWGEEQLIYIDSSDERIRQELEKDSNCTLTIAESSFIGGIRAVINGNILMDNSFLSKIEELKESFGISKYIEEHNLKISGGGING